MQISSIPIIPIENHSSSHCFLFGRIVDSLVMKMLSVINIQYVNILSLNAIARLVIVRKLITMQLEVHAV